MKIQFILFIFITVNAIGQSISGEVLDKNKKPIVGASVYWQNEPQNVVISDTAGKFEIQKNPNNELLIVSLVGFQTDSVNTYNKNSVLIILKDDVKLLKELSVNGSASFVDKSAVVHTETLTSKSLAKAACCNLSESFETNASVSVNYSDAVTGAKQIQLLGLAGINIQTNLENTPNIRGLASTFGLNYIPGTWIQSIDISKGIGSVLNGYENIGGVINVELKKPEISEKLLLNMYLNNFGRSEINLNLSNKINKKWSVGLLSHGSFLKSKIDNNGDAFLDMPMYSQINILNRWKYQSEKMMAQLVVKYLNENRLGGQKDFVSRIETPNLYGFTNQTQKFEVYSKTAKLYQSKPYRGLGLILSGNYHQSDSYFGFRPYLATQKSFYSNLIYQDIIGNTAHTYKTGFSFLADNYDERYGQLLQKRNEIVPGAFIEYTYNRLNKTILVLGYRQDFHNLFGIQGSPRLHFKQEIGKNDVLRLSVGRGFRVPNLLAENFGNLVSSRVVTFLDKIQPEVAWTSGGSYTKNMGKLNLSAEYYKTIFTKLWAVDLERSNLLYFYLTKGQTSSALLEANYKVSQSWELKLAYRYVNSTQIMGNPLNEHIWMQKAFVNKNRILLNVAYALPNNKWKIDATAQWNGKRRIPDLVHGEHINSYYSLPLNYVSGYMNINSQITRTFLNSEWYLGVENLTGYKQKNPIMYANDPFGSNFDAGMVWAPIVGQTVYLGFRYKIL